VDSWNDERMDELSRRMDAGFEKAATKEEMNWRFDKIDARLDGFEGRLGRFERSVESHFGRLNDRLDKLTFAIIGILGTFAAATFATILGSVLS
jgi:hypothetical protein